MATAQVVTRPGTPAKASTSTPAAPRAADPRGNSRPPASVPVKRPQGPQRGGQGQVNVTSSPPYRSGSEKTKEAIGRGAGAVAGAVGDAARGVGGFATKNPGAVAGLVTAGPLGAVVGYGAGKVDWGKQVSRETAIDRKQKQRESAAATDRNREARDKQRTPAGAYAPPGYSPSSRPAPVPKGAGKTGVGGTVPVAPLPGSSTPTVAPPTPSAKAPADTPGRGSTGPGRAPANVPTPKPGGAGGQKAGGAGPAKPGGGAPPKPGGGAPAKPGGGAPAKPQPAGVPTPQAQAQRPTISVDDATKGPLKAPSTVSFQAGGNSYNIDLPAGLNLKGVDTTAIGSNVNQRIQQAGGIAKVPNGTVLHTFRGAAGVSFNVTKQNGRIVVTRAGAAGGAPAAGATGGTTAGTPADTTPASGEPGAAGEETPVSTQPVSETPTPPAAPGTTPPPQTAVEFANQQLQNNPQFGMPVANLNATAEMEDLVNKLGFSLTDTDGKTVDPRLLFDSEGKIDPAKIAQYKLRLRPATPGGVGQELTGENYLGFQVNPEVAGTESQLLGTELGRMILEQKQRRAELLESQSKAGATGGAAGRARDIDKTARALGYTNIVTGESGLGGGLRKIAANRLDALQRALDRILQNPEAYGYQAPGSSTPGATPPTTPGAAPSGTGATTPPAQTPTAGTVPAGGANVRVPAGERPPNPAERTALDKAVKNAKWGTPTSDKKKPPTTTTRSKPFKWRGKSYILVKTTKNGKTTTQLTPA